MSVTINVLLIFLIPQMVILLQLYTSHMDAPVHLIACMYIMAFFEAQNDTNYYMDIQMSLQLSGFQ